MKKRTCFWGYGKREQRLEAKAAYLLARGYREAADAVAKQFLASRAAARGRSYTPRVRGTGIPAPRHGWRYKHGQLVRRSL